MLTDDELRGIEPPTLFMIGENETLYPAKKAVDRIRTVAPHLKTVIIKNAGHDITLVQAQEVNDTVISFIK